MDWGCMATPQPKLQPWSPADYTTEIRRIAIHPKLTLSRTKHFVERLLERDLIMSDALYVLKNGFVYDVHEDSSQPGLYKYRTETRTPNSSNRNVRLVVIPDATKCWIKIVTVMWVDE
jgi:Domain of unknown function (DUF4258)